jgi:hypothetical protein
MPAVITTRRPSGLPAPERLEQLCRVLALVDGIVCPDESMRMFEFAPRWSRTARTGRFRDSGGDECFFWFSRAGAVIVGYTKTGGSADPDDVFRGLPAPLDAARTEPSFGDEVSFALWRTPRDDRWQAGKTRKDDGSGEILRFDHPLGYLELARLVYGESAPEMRWVDALWCGKSLTPEIARGLGGDDVDVKAALALAKELGLPYARGAPVVVPARRGAPPPAPASSGKPPGPAAHDAFFVVSMDRGVVSLSFGGKPVASRKDADLYDHLADYARRAIEGPIRSK